MTVFRPMVSPDLGKAAGFLQWLYANTTEPGWLTLFTVEKASGQRYTEWSPLEEMPNLNGRASRGDVWFGVAPRRENLGPYRRGGVADCLSTPAFYVDIDVRGPHHKITNLPESYEDARRLARRFPLEPSAVVRSGYGLQVWWRLTEALEADLAKSILPRWQATWEGYAEEFGWHIDNVSDIDRIMRLPGTFNFKGSEPVPVNGKWLEHSAYEISEVVDELVELSPREEKRRSSTAHLAGSRFNERVTCQQVLEGHGCQRVRIDPVTGDEHWRYRDATNETSATVYAEDGHCAIWSETMAEAFGLETRRPYDPFGLWVHLAYGGDFALAHSTLVAHGVPDLDGLEALAPPEPIQVLFDTAAGVTPTKVEWLWYGWLPKGKLIVLDADPDAGKSTVMLDIASRLTRGAEMPDGSSGTAPADVLLLAGEDDLNDTIIWRLMAAGANLNRVHVHRGTYTQSGGEVPLLLPLHLQPIREAIVRYRAALVIVDVFDEYIDDRVDTYKNASVRKALAPIRQAAAETGATFVILRHLRKEGSAKAIYRGGGSIGIVGAARGGWVIGYLPEDESVRVLATSKMNIAPRPRPMAFKLRPHEQYPCAFVDWRGPLEDMTADQLLDPRGGKDSEEKEEKKSLKQQAEDAMREALKDGPMWSGELYDLIIDGLKLGRKAYDDARAKLTFSWPETMPDGTRSWRVRLRDDHQ